MKILALVLVPACLLCADDPVKVPYQEASLNRIGPVPPIRSSSRSKSPFQSVAIRLVIDTQGKVRSASVFRGQSSEFRDRALAIVRQLEYRPFLRDGVPVEVETSEDVRILPLEKMPETHVAFPEVNDPFAVEFFLKRGSGGLNASPIYELRIRGDGTVTYDGTSNVAVTGKRIAYVTQDEVRDVLDAFRKADFYSLSKEYSIDVFDIPVYTIGIKIGEASKVVVDHAGEEAGMPEIVRVLEEELDATANSSRWVKGLP